MKASFSQTSARMKETTLYDSVIKWRNLTHARRPDNTYKGNINQMRIGEATLYDNVIKWRDRANAHRQDNTYKGNINQMSPGEHRYYELPENYYGFRRRKGRPVRQPTIKSTQPIESPPRDRMQFSPLPPPRDSQRETTAESSRYPLIPVQLQAPPEENFDDFPVGPFNSTPIFYDRPEPIFPPLVPINRSDGYDRDNRRIVPGYNAVGSILRSLKIQGR